MTWYNRYIIRTMAVHKCNHEVDFGTMNTKIADLEKIVKGPEGIQTITIELNQAVKALTETVKSLTTAVSAVVKYQNESEGAARADERYKVNKQWAWGTAIGVLGVIGGVLIALLK